MYLSHWDDVRRELITIGGQPEVAKRRDPPLASATSLYHEATLVEMYAPIFAGWAMYLRRPTPKLRTVQNWAWEPERSGFPAARGVRATTVSHRPARVYNVGEVLRWYVEYSAFYWR